MALVRTLVGSLVLVGALVGLLACGGGGASSPTTPTSPTTPSTPTPTTVTGTVTEFFSGQVQAGVQVCVEQSGTSTCTTTDGAGRYTITPTLASSTVDLLFNFGRQSGRIESLLAVKVPGKVLTTGANVQNMDLASIPTMWGSYSPDNMIKVFRGNHLSGINQHWTSQPKEWVIFDPPNEKGACPESPDPSQGCLRSYGDPRNNPLFERIYANVFLIGSQECTDGFLRVPSREDIVIKSEAPTPVNIAGNVSYFPNPMGGDGYQATLAQITASVTFGPAYDGAHMKSEACDAVWGDDNDPGSEGYKGPFSNSPAIDDIARANFKFGMAREIGSVIVAPSVSDTGFVYEIRSHPNTPSASGAGRMAPFSTMETLGGQLLTPPRNPAARTRR